MRVEPHLCFGGTCEAAFRFYATLFAGTLETLMKYGGSPMADDVPAEFRDKVVHATLRLPNGDALLGADIAPDAFQTPQGFYVFVALPDAGEAARVFAELATNGTVKLALKKTFWSPCFGVVVDRFGIPWEITTQ